MNKHTPAKGHTYLFVHQNFPGQFKFLAPTLAAMPGNQVKALTIRTATQTNKQIDICKYTPVRSSTQNIHPWLSSVESKIIRGEAAMRAAVTMRNSGFNPDVIIAHPGWGESLFLKQVWPKAKLGLYCEFYYHASGADVGFDPEFGQSDLEQICHLRLKNVPQELQFEQADAGLSPTHWQRSVYPEPFRSRISVIHDGIDTQRLQPDPAVKLRLSSGLVLSRDNEVITFVNRNLEPYRGYHSFMRALPEILRRRPNAHVVIVGNDKTGYGAAAPEGKTWKEIFLAEVSSELDPQRVHFVGQLPYSQFISLLQLSSVHIYLTYPFVLSWSLMEAMSCGCAIVASDTAPLREVIVDNETGLLTDFFDTRALAEKVCSLLADPGKCSRLGQAARQFVIANYDLQTCCLPRQLAWVRQLIK